jgi:hypothetical protein
MRYHFSFRSSYQGQHDYAAYDRETRETHRLSVIREPRDHQLRSDQPVGTVRGCAWRLPIAMVDAFNAWRAERYGQPSELVGAWWDDVWHIERVGPTGLSGPDLERWEAAQL